jgi:transposase
MRIETILNNCQKFKCFVYKNARWSTKSEHLSLDVDLTPRKNSAAICSHCHKSASLYDKASEMRRFEFVPMWGYPVYFNYRMRRVNCKRCSIVVEEVPWGLGKSTLTKSYMQYLSGLAKKISWQEAARSFHTSWRKVFESVRFVVEFGLKNRSVSDVESIGVDEIAIQKGHKYITVVYQIDKHCVRLLWAGKGRSVKTLLRCFHKFGQSWADGLKHICSDMWKPYLKVIKKKALNALHILDRFHIMANLIKPLTKLEPPSNASLRKTVMSPY